MPRIPVISSYVLRGLPEFIRSEIGDRALLRANRAAGFDSELIEDQNFYISQRSMLDFLGSVARSAGDPDIGLVAAPSMNVASYGAFGQYIFGADTLGMAIRRAIASLPYHSSYDTLTAAASGDELQFSYKLALAGSDGYAVAASAAAGELLSVFRNYVPTSWRPLRIELDIPAPRQASKFEDVFQCPVRFNATAVSLVGERDILRAPTTRPVQRKITIQDVARESTGGPPRRFLDVTSEQILVQLLTGEIAIENIAASLDTSIRTLQRKLARAGTDFRTLTGNVRVERATKLLGQTDMSMTAISQELAYSSATSFSRAFRSAMSVSPREYRESTKLKSPARF